MAKWLIDYRCGLGHWVMSGVGREMGVLDGGGGCQKGKGSFGGKCGASRCNQCGQQRALPKLLWGGLVSVNHATVATTYFV